MKNSIQFYQSVPNDLLISMVKSGVFTANRDNPYPLIRGINQFLIEVTAPCLYGESGCSPFSPPRIGYLLSFREEATPMADSSITSTGPISTLLRAQTTNLTALTNSQQATQKLIDQLADGAKPSTVQPAVKTAGASKGNLPRGSLFDILA
jgi:hypothetical protein